MITDRLTSAVLLLLTLHDRCTVLTNNNKTNLTFSDTCFWSVSDLSFQNNKTTTTRKHFLWNGQVCPASSSQ